MATNKEFIRIVATGFRPQVVTSATKLRRYAEQKVVMRPLTWEEWVDIRDGWAKANKALLITTPKGDLKLLQQATEEALAGGYEYLLLENV